MSTLNKSVSNFDMLQTITGTEYQPYLPNFMETPSVSNISLYSCSIEGRLDNYGFIFVIGIATANDTSKPKAV